MKIVKLSFLTAIAALFFSVSVFAQGAITHNLPPDNFFFSGVLGINYASLGDIENSAFIPDDVENVQLISNSPAFAGGGLLDAQFRVSNHRNYYAGFETGVFASAKGETDFDAQSNTGKRGSNKIETRFVLVPFLFTFSHYSDTGNFLLTAKLGPSLLYRSSDLEEGLLKGEGSNLRQRSATSVSLTLGMDGRFKLVNHLYALVGFMATPFPGLIRGDDDKTFGISFNGIWDLYGGLSYRIP